MVVTLGKDYSSIYLSILGLVEKTLKDLYHGLRLQSQLTEWAQDAWYVFGPAAELIDLKSFIQEGGASCGYHYREARPFGD